MKRHFLTGLKALAVSALAFAAVSCYDDALVWEEIDGLKDRVTALETKLNSEVATINTTLGTLAAADKKLADEIAAVVADVKKTKDLVSALDAYDKTLDGKIEDLDAALAAFEDETTKQLAAAIAKIAVVKAEKNEAGNYVLTFADGKTLEVVSAANSNNTGVITTVEKDGVTYWAVIGADGKTTVLEATVHPDTKLEFKVDPETNELLVAYDGKTWEKTGVIVNDDTTINVVTDFVDGDDYVTVTVAGKEYKLPKYVADNSELVLGREKMFVTYGTSKKVKLEGKGISEYYVMSKPDGWKVSLEGTTLTVTPPAKEVVNLGAGEQKGEVLVHATASNGNCKVVKLVVETGDVLSMTYENEMLTIFNAATYEEQMEDGSVGKSFKQVWSGLVPIEDFLAFENLNEFYDLIWGEFICTNLYQRAHNDSNNNYEMQYYSEGTQEEQELTISLKDVASYLDVELDDETIYVAYSFYAGQTVDYETAKYVVLGDYVNVTFDNETYNNVDITMASSNGTFIVGATSKTFLDNLAVMYELEEFTLQMYMQMGTGGPDGGPWTKFANGDATALGKQYKGTNNTFKLSDIIIDYDAEVEAENEYYVWVLPVSDNRSNESYQLSELRTYVCNSGALTLNDALVATNTSITGSYYSATFSLTPPAGGSTYYGVFKKADFVKLDNAAKIMALKQDCPYPTDEEISDETTNFGIAPGTEYVFATYSLKDGECGPVTMTEFTTPSIQEVESITVELESLSELEGSYIAVLNVTGATKVAGYNITYRASTDYNTPFVKALDENHYSHSNYTWVTVADNKATVTFKANANKKDYIVWAYNIDPNGNITMKRFNFNIEDNLQ